MKPPVPVLLFALAGLLGGCASSATNSRTTPAAPDDGAPISAPAEAAGTAAEARSLEGTAWALVRLQDEALVLPPATRRPFLAFTADGRMHGFGGVNRMSGQPRVDGPAIAFGNLLSTRMAGPSAAMAIEMRFMESLRVTTGWRIVDGNLELLSEGRVVAILHPIPDDETD